MFNNTRLGQKFFNIYKHLDHENRVNDKVAIISEVDMSKSMALRSEFKKHHGSAPCITSIITKAVAEAVKKHPHVNNICTGFYFKKRHSLEAIDFTFAVERNLSSGEMVTYTSTIEKTDTKDLMSIDGELRDLSNKPPELDDRWNLFYKLVKYAPSFLAKMIVSSPNWSKKLWQKHRGGAFLISSPCKYGGDSLVAAWPWPICFSFGILKDRPMVIEDKIVIRPTLNLTLSFDRCYMPGAPAARFFQDIVEGIEKATYSDFAIDKTKEEIIPLFEDKKAKRLS